MNNSVLEFMIPGGGAILFWNYTVTTYFEMKFVTDVT